MKSYYSETYAFVNNSYQSFTIRYQCLVLALEITSEHLILMKFEDSISPAPPSRDSSTCGKFYSSVVLREYSN